MLRTDDVAESSQLAIKERSALAKATRMTMHGTMMVVQAERLENPLHLQSLSYSGWPMMLSTFLIMTQCCSMLSWPAMHILDYIRDAGFDQWDMYIFIVII